MVTQTKINGGEVYKKVLTETSLAVNDFIQSRIRKLNLESTLEESLLLLPTKRSTKNIMRPTLTYLIYRANGGQGDIQEVLPFLAISELNNYYCYLDNWILDNKSNVREDLHQIRKITIASQMLRDLTQVVLEETSLAEDEKRAISQRLSETTMKCYEGQSRDLEMTLNSLSKYSSNE